MLFRFVHFVLFQEFTFSKKSFRNTPWESQTVLDPGQAQHFVGPDLVPTCLQRLSVDNSNRQRLKWTKFEKKDGV